MLVCGNGCLLALLAGGRCARDAAIKSSLVEYSRGGDDDVNGNCRRHLNILIRHGDPPPNAAAIDVRSSCCEATTGSRSGDDDCANGSTRKEASIDAAENNAGSSDETCIVQLLSLSDTLGS